VPRLALVLRLIVPSVWVNGRVLRLAEQRVRPRYDRKDQEPRLVVMVQKWDEIVRRWIDAPGIGRSALRSDFRLCGNALKALNVAVGSRRQAEAPDAREPSRFGGATPQSDAGEGLLQARTT